MAATSWTDLSAERSGAGRCRPLQLEPRKQRQAAGSTSGGSAFSANSVASGWRGATRRAATTCVAYTRRSTASPQPRRQGLILLELLKAPHLGQSCRCSAALCSDRTVRGDHGSHPPDCAPSPVGSLRPLARTIGLEAKRLQPCSGRALASPAQRGNRENGARERRSPSRNPRLSLEEPGGTLLLPRSALTGHHIALSTKIRPAPHRSRCRWGC